MVGFMGNGTPPNTPYAVQPACWRASPKLLGRLGKNYVNLDKKCEYGILNCFTNVLKKVFLRSAHQTNHREIQ